MSRQLYGLGSELDLRTELEGFLGGDDGEIAKQKTLILRKFRRDEQDELVPCTCVNSLTKEADGELECPFCLGEGFYFDEQWLFAYSRPTETDKYLSSKIVQMQPGQISAYDRLFYCRFTESMTYADKIIELKLDSEGIPTLPYKRQHIYRIDTIVEYRSDLGRLEYWGLYCTEYNSIRKR